MITAILGWTIAGVAGVIGAGILLALALLSIPLVVELQGRPAQPVSIRIVWLFGAFAKQIVPKDSQKTRYKPGKKDGNDRRKLGKKRSRSAVRRRRALRIASDTTARRAVVSAVSRWVRDTLRCFKPKVTGVVIAGCADPGDTGFIFGIVAPVIYRIRQAWGVSIVPVYDTHGVYLVGEASISLVPVTVLPPTIHLIFSRPGWLLLRTLQGKE